MCDIYKNFSFGVKARKVYVDRQRSMMEAVEATGLSKIAFNEKALMNVPSVEEYSLEIHLIPLSNLRLGTVHNFSELFSAIDKVGYKFVDPVAFCALYECDKYAPGSITMWFDKSEGMVAYIHKAIGGGFPGESYIGANYTGSAHINTLLACVLK